MSSRIRWNFQRPRRPIPQNLYSGFSVDRAVSWRVSVDRTSRGNELTVRHLVAADAGVYSCHDVKNFSRKVDFRLVVKGACLFVRPFRRPRRRIFTARCYASAVLAVGLCPCPCPCPCPSVTNRSSTKTDERIGLVFGHGSFIRPILHCVIGKFMYLQK